MSDYKRLGDYIRETNVRNTNESVELLLGVSVNKEFIPSIANTVGTNFKRYKVVRRHQFCYIPDTSRRGDKIGVAMLDENDAALVSQAYLTFEIIDHNSLMPEYLMMWFRRSEFDRYARYKSHGSVREAFGWKEMCNVQLPVPTIETQRKTVAEHNTVKNRIDLNNQLIQKLEETAQAIYKHWFVDFEFPDENGKPYKSSGGKMVWNEELGKEVPEGWEVKRIYELCRKIGSGATPKGGKDGYQTNGVSLIRSMNVHDYHFMSEGMAYINEQQADKLKNAEVKSKDILINITGVSVARCAIVPDYVLPARVNQHVMIIRPTIQISNYLMLLLCHHESKSKLSGISQSGSTREAITKSEIEGFQVVLPLRDVYDKFEELISILFGFIENKRKESYKLSSFLKLLNSKLATIDK